MVGARGPGTEQISQRVQKEEKCCRVGGVPTGAGLVRALISGEGVREGLAWRGKAGWVRTGAGLVDGGSGRQGKGSGGGARASVAGG